MRKPWDRTILTVKWWEGQEPESGDELETKTGRRYSILFIKRRPDGSIRALDCLVLPSDEPIKGRVFNWTWASRRRA